jgi:hypothetical protein
MNINNITWVTSVGPKYFEEVAKHNWPTWNQFLLGKKIIMADHMPGFKYEGFDIIDSIPAYPEVDVHYSIKGKKHKFWRKGKCFIWAIKNCTSRYLIWLDSDVRVHATPDLTRFMPEEGQTASIICGNLLQAESGFVVVDCKHPLLESWLKVYEEAWYNGIIDTLHKPWDNDVLWYALKELPHKNLSKTIKSRPEGFEDTDLLDYMFHYSGKEGKNLIPRNE